MKRDIIGDIFLGGILLSLLFLLSFPAYFIFGGVQARPIELTERIMSICFTLAWILAIVWCCWKKKVWVMLGMAVFGFLAYIPKWFIPKVNMRIILNGTSLLDSFLSMFLNRVYEMMHAPFSGFVGIVSEKSACKMAELLFPSIVISYVLSQIVRYYHQAYVAEKKSIRDFADFRKANATRKPIGLENAVREIPAPLGTIVLNEKAEIASETIAGQAPQAVASTTTTNIASAENTVRVPNLDLPNLEAPKEDETQVIALAAHAPSSKEETKVIPLAAHAPSSEDKTQVIQLAAHAPSSADETQVIALAATAPSSGEANKPEQQDPPKEELDFPDVRGEAEKIDVFGDES